MSAGKWCSGSGEVRAASGLSFEDDENGGVVVRLAVRGGGAVRGGSNGEVCVFLRLGWTGELMSVS